MLKHESVRYLINGVSATLVNYGILNFNMLVLNIKSAGIANFIASGFGITASFFGSRYFVYKEYSDTISSQIVRFLLFYIFLAIIMGFILYVWSDLYGLNYHIGFVVATVMQMLSSYFGNKFLVFKK